ncbi:AEC family transporter [Leptolyngbya sp. CCNP1308]|uniref:AEC family transporter n=1 Tax=Leptolyngbya sp. CCNP1308 TaxID=3110255 RepID=UPI002B211289|nr:AEC family transporter [Leptolyngbya sp. CCNP1308]MEA5448690.1 AEC family transporter [Leptolyngbya sp. CCNP1308]
MFIQLLPLILVGCLGYGLKRAGVLGPGDAKAIGTLLTHLALPAVILKALATASITSELVYLPLSALIVVLGLTLIGLVAIRGLGWERAKAGALMTTFPTFEGGAVGYPLMLLAYGEVGLSRIVLFDLAQAVYLLTVVYSLSAWFGQAGVTARAVALKLGQTPFFWAIVLGLLMNSLEITHPALLSLLDIVGGSFLLLVLLLVGMEFEVQMAGLGEYGLVALAKISCGLGLGWLAAIAFGLEGVERAAVLLGAALPPSLLTLFFTQENALDSRFASGLISVAIPLYLAAMVPLLAVITDPGPG